MELKQRKRSKMTLLVLVMILLTTISAFATEIQGTVIATESIVRSTNNFNGNVVTTLTRGSKITILEIKDQWYRVKDANEKEGWMYRDLVTIDKAGIEKKGIITATILNVRSEASTSSKILAKLSEGTEVNIITGKGDWIQILLPNNETGWIHRDYVKVMPNLPQGIILRDDSPLKDTNSDSSKTLVVFNKNDILYIKSYENGWYQVVTEKYQEGWMKEEFIDLRINVTRPVSRSGERSSVFTDISDVTSKYLGKKYGWGQTGPNRFDCSGFTYYILKTYYGEYIKAKGINLPRSSKDQATVGVNVSRADLRPGDLVFFNTDGKINKTITHVGIYLGNGEFIHASSARSVVMISSLQEGYYNTRYIKAVRL